MHPSLRILVGCALILWATVAAAWRLEAGEAVAPSTTGATSFTTINFQNAFGQRPIVLVLPTEVGGDPTTLRIRNVTTSSFDVALREPTGSDGAHIAQTFHYVAIEPGIHRFPTGEVIVAGEITTSAAIIKNSLGTPSSWLTVPFGVTLPTTATAVATIQTDNSEINPQPSLISVPWLTVAMRNATSSSIQMLLERSEAPAGTVLPERIGYVAFATSNQNTFTDINNNSVGWSTRNTGSYIQGWDNGCRTFTYTSVPFVGGGLLVASKNSRKGVDGGWTRRCSLTRTSVGFVIDEDIATDSERSHAREIVGMIAFSRSFHAVLGTSLNVAKRIVNVVDLQGNDLSVPGARTRYAIEVQSEGIGTVDSDSIEVVDAIPPETSLVVTDISGPGSGPVRFIDGSPSSTLTYSFTSLSSTTDDLAFSDDGGSSFNYTPTAGTDGTDPAVTHVKVGPAGTMPAPGTGGGAAPSFTLELNVVID